MSTLVELLHRRGFNRTEEPEPGERHVTPRCSQCEVVVINGMACHERGCPNYQRNIIIHQKEVDDE